MSPSCVACSALPMPSASRRRADLAAGTLSQSGHRVNRVRPGCDGRRVLLSYRADPPAKAGAQTERSALRGAATRAQAALTKSEAELAKAKADATAARAQTQ